MTVTITKDRVLEMLRSVRGLTRNEVLIGVPDSNAERTADPENPTPLSNAAIGYLMETGAPEKNLPARPFLVPGVTEAAPALVERLKKAGNAAILSPGGKQIVERAMHDVGNKAQRAVQDKILNGPFAPLSERTLQARARRATDGGKLSKSATSKAARAELASRAAGNLPTTDAKPLVDTRSLLGSINYVVRPKGKK